MGQALEVVVVSASFMARHEGLLPAGSFGTTEHESRNVIICGQQTLMVLVYTTNLYLAQFISTLAQGASSQLSEIIYRTDFSWVDGSLNSLDDHTLTLKDRPAKALSLYY